MLTNEKMRPGRFARWYEVRQKLAYISEQVEAGRTVYLATVYRKIIVRRKDLPRLTAKRNGLFLESGRSTVCVDGCAIQVGG